jgi:hypothetical protein
MVVLEEFIELREERPNRDTCAIGHVLSISCTGHIVDQALRA